MQTRTLYSIMFFKDVICRLSCEVMEDFNYRHIPSTYHVVHLRYEIRLRQLQSLIQRNAEFHDKHFFNKMGDTV